ncbi:MAG: Lrp/AsnC family transcriptional regulator, partial [Candidatus Poribacteria bacterium]|nr:Lrp/AsnC family transcriptional regulator [Candidatus Poribacteria bacterium]
ERTKTLRRSQIIRQISAIFDTRALGYKSSLVAFKTPEDRVMEAARIINRHPGVTHNYERNHPLNIWFTIATPPESSPEEDVKILAEESGSSYRMLPTLVLYKIGVKLDMSENAVATAESEDKGFRRPVKQVEITLSAKERSFVREMQKQIEYVAEPFAPIADAVGVSQSELFEMASDFQQRKLMRRFAAILRHQNAGYNVNAMGVWCVPPDDAHAAGDAMSSFRNVSHCYLRPTYPDWPYNLFSMIHGRSDQDCKDVAAAIQEKTGIQEYAMLYSVREFKKTRLEYFTEDYDKWAAKYKEPALVATS